MMGYDGRPHWDDTPLTAEDRRRIEALRVPDAVQEAAHASRSSLPPLSPVEMNAAARTDDEIDRWFPRLGLPGTRQLGAGAWSSDLLSTQQGSIERCDWEPGDDIPLDLSPCDAVAHALGFVDEFGAPDQMRGAQWLWNAVGVGSHRNDGNGQSSEVPALLGFMASDLADKPVPPREWLCEGLIPMNTVTLLAGDGGTGKSLLAAQLAVSVSAGTAWLGREVRQGGAIFVTAEDDVAECHRRLDAIGRMEGIPWGDMARLRVASLAGEDAVLAAPGADGVLGTSAVFRSLEHTIAHDRPAVVFIDTLADAFGGDEIKRTQARQFIGLLRGLAIDYGCAVIVLSHPSLTGMASGTGSSGSTAWGNSVRSRLYLERVIQDGYESDPDARILRTTKANYGRTGAEISVRYEAGVFVSKTPETGIDRQAASAKAERVFLKLLDAFNEDGRRVSASPGPTHAPSMFAKHADAEGCTKRALTGAMDALFSRSEIAIETHGRASKQRSHLVRKGSRESEE
ncbi:MAG: AAA family ATPase [Pseudomonadota bacterium]